MMIAFRHTLRALTERIRRIFRRRPQRALFPVMGHQHVPRVRRRRDPSRRWRRRALGLALALTLGAFGASLLTLVIPREHVAASRVITIAPGTDARRIVRMLQEHGLLAHPLPVLAYLTLTGHGARLKAGDYRFPSPISPLEVIRRLVRGEVVTEKITIPEGLNRFEIAELVRRLPIPDAERALEFTEDVSLIRDLDPQADSLEGYLFPDTYAYAPSTSARDLIARMVRRFREVFTEEDRARARQLGFTVREIVTLASLIEEEAKLPEERPIISSVFHNRLRRGMRLECDPTVLYAALLQGEDDGTIHRSDLARRSPYNTYLYPGLPPGPIASPGRESLRAALYPAQTDYLYFVVDGTRQDGAHRFARTFAEHQANVVLYRRAQARSARLSP
ncbi:MAG: endolytic transglycosylase MltG [Blastocatellia bacterium]|nr:endolytic transglycosylase MltG [Blastocatellia bacterium]MCS7158241.1 endolytic transglycosylase MltG [Blastocatellia bacterium]MCX7753079.1 endolytic transglycosylase MltG [Blastocatellia bacterium]MDW8169395.1 endolytic transglycosylase MltG [Acidobacteriota bacterium]MDW8256462.1 endolytic transglycosylase MltG [Acidobacteriota bacterium]